jgi:hypothetical protein
MWYQSIDVPLRMPRWMLFLSFIQSLAVKEHKTVKHYIIEISSNLLVIFKHWGKFMVVALGAG